MPLQIYFGFAHGFPFVFDNAVWPSPSTSEENHPPLPGWTYHVGLVMADAAEAGPDAIRKVQKDSDQHVSEERLEENQAQPVKQRKTLNVSDLAETKISPKLYTPRVLPTIRGCLEGLALMMKQPRMVGTFLKVHTRPRLAYALRSQCRGY